MTASKTPNLGLMSPVASDAFKVEDFANTFSIVDKNPGILTVANQASRPTNFTAAQHGRIVLQADTQILWMWSQPSSGQAGGWIRVGNKGFLGKFLNGGTVGTSTTNRQQGATVVEGTLLVPGGRDYSVWLSWDLLASHGSRIVTSYWENNVRISDQVFTGVDVNANPEPGTTPESGTFFYHRPGPASATNITFKLTIAAFEDRHPWGGGYTSITNGGLHVLEV